MHLVALLLWLFFCKYQKRGEIIKRKLSFFSFTFNSLPTKMKPIRHWVLNSGKESMTSCPFPLQWLTMQYSPLRKQNTTAIPFSRTGGKFHKERMVRVLLLQKGGNTEWILSKCYRDQAYAANLRLRGMLETSKRLQKECSIHIQ